MSGLENLKRRLDYNGGNAEQRFQKDKLNSLKKALLYSYQAATAILSDGREFRCLINGDKTKADYDNKILSIPYQDICLGYAKVTIDESGDMVITEDKKKPNNKTINGIEDINIKPGDVFIWKETKTKWIVYLEYLEEDSYFRAEIRKCESEIIIDDTKYPIYIRGPVETTIQWNQKKGDLWNNLNYSLVIYITKNQQTLDYFHRFTQIEIDKKMWEVSAVDEYSADGIIEIVLKETFNNPIEKYANYKQRQKIGQEHLPDEIYIDGPTEVYPYEKYKYIIKNANVLGKWTLNTNKAHFLEINADSVTIGITTGRSGSFNLIYYISENNQITLPIVIKSL